jgi:hypothetical protein
MLRTYKVEDEMILKSPTYYVDNETEKIIAEEQWECSFKYKYEFPGYSSNLYCEGIYVESQNDYFELNIKRIYKARDLYLHLLVNCGVNISS